MTTAEATREPDGITSTAAAVLAALKKRDGSAGGSAANGAAVSATVHADPAATAPVASPPAELLSTQRVQLSVRGQRFEMTMATALNYLVGFRAFLLAPVCLSTDACRHDAAVPDDAVEAVRAALGQSTTTWQLAGLGASRASPAAPPPIISGLLLAHYHRTAAPALAAAAAALSPRPCDGTDPLPGLFHPVNIEFDAAGGIWKLVFARHLPADVAVLEQQRLHRLQERRRRAANAAPAGEQQQQQQHGQIYALEPNENPFLLLQPHFLGIIVVHMRRASKELDKHRGTGDGAGAAPAHVPFPARWAELEYDAQLSLAMLVRCLGVSTLLRSFSAPTADIATSDFHDDAADEEEKAAVVASGSDSGDGSLAVSGEVEGGWAREGCAACGLSGHPTSQCPYMQQQQHK